ncbi:MAG TPA: type IX secretion system membrane protein PorP/SprF [Bacteroidales bacterium]|nr:type IX secretion system membrane protein PorP/SprF [Bacteroidales bacterium]
MKKFSLILMLLSISAISFAQQDPIFTQYMFNKLPINPAYAGSSEALSLDLIDRFQWVGIKDGPNTLSFTASTNLPNPHLGLGLYAYRDAVGPTVETGMMGSFAYRILFPAGKLSFGVQFGFDYMNVDWNALNPNDPEDPIINNQVKQRAVPDAGAGIYFYSDKYYVGISSTHLIESSFLVSTTPETDNTSFTRLLRHFYLMGGGIISLSDNLKLRPSALVRYSANVPVQADIDMSFLIYNVLWLGVGYRTENCLKVMAEVNIAKNLHVGYSYDIWFNPLQAYNKGSHEIRLGYDFDIFKTGRMQTPRYF